MLNRFFAITQSSKLATQNLWVIERNDKGDCRMEKLASLRLFWVNSRYGANQKLTPSGQGEVNVGTSFQKADRVLVTSHGGICLFLHDRRLDRVNCDESLAKSFREISMRDFPYWRGRTERVLSLQLEEPKHWLDGWDNPPAVDADYCQPWQFIDWSEPTTTVEVLEAIGKDDPNLIIEDEVWSALPMMKLGVNARAIAERSFEHGDIQKAAEEMGDNYEEMRNLLFQTYRELNLGDPVDAARNEVITKTYWTLIEKGLLFVPNTGIAIDRFVIKPKQYGYGLTQENGEELTDHIYSTPHQARNHLQPYLRGAANGGY